MSNPNLPDPADPANHADYDRLLADIERGFVRGDRVRFTFEGYVCTGMVSCFRNSGRAATVYFEHPVTGEQWGITAPVATFTKATAARQPNTPDPAAALNPRSQPTWQDEGEGFEEGGAF